MIIPSNFHTGSPPGVGILRFSLVCLFFSLVVFSFSFGELRLLLDGWGGAKRLTPADGDIDRFSDFSLLDSFTPTRVKPETTTALGRSCQADERDVRGSKPPLNFFLAVSLLSLVPLYFPYHMATAATPQRSTSVNPSLSASVLSSATQNSPSWFIPLDKKNCVVCSKDEDFEQFFYCDKCGNLFHYSCTQLPMYELVKYMRNQYKRKYTCSSCVEKLHPNESLKITQLMKNNTNQSMHKTDPDTLMKEIEECKEKLKQKQKKIQEMKKEIDNLKKMAEKNNDELKRKEKKIQELRGEIEKKAAIRERQEEAQRRSQPGTQEEEEEEEDEEEEEEEKEEKEDDDEEEQNRAFYEGLRRLIREETKDIIEDMHNKLNKIEEKMNTKEDKHPVNQRDQPVQRHLEEEQPQFRPIQQLRRPPFPRRRPPPPMRRPPPRCYNCGKIGHIARQCFQQRPITFPAQAPRRPWTYQPTQDRYRTVQTVGENGGIRVTPFHQLRQQDAYTQSKQQQHQNQHQQQYQQPMHYANRYERAPFYNSIPPTYF